MAYELILETMISTLVSPRLKQWSQDDKRFKQ